MEIPLQNPKCTCVSIGLCVECWRRRLGNDVEDRTFLLQLRVRRRGHADICSSGVQSARLCGSFPDIQEKLFRSLKDTQNAACVKTGWTPENHDGFWLWMLRQKIEGRRDVAMTVCCRQLLALNSTLLSQTYLPPKALAATDLRCADSLALPICKQRLLMTPSCGSVESSGIYSSTRREL